MSCIPLLWDLKKINCHVLHLKAMNLSVLNSFEKNLRGADGVLWGRAGRRFGSNIQVNAKRRTHEFSREKIAEVTCCKCELGDWLFPPPGVGRCWREKRQAYNTKVKQRFRKTKVVVRRSKEQRKRREDKRKKADKMIPHEMEVNTKTFKGMRHWAKHHNKFITRCNGSVYFRPGCREISRNW